MVDRFDVTSKQNIEQGLFGPEYHQRSTFAAFDQRLDDPRTEELATKESDDPNNPLWDVGKVAIDDLVLFSLVGKVGGVDLKNRFATIEITQSIFSPFMTMYCTIGAGIGLVERFATHGLQGEEFIYIKCYTPKRESLIMTFYVTNVDVKHDELNQASSVLLTCVSKEKLINDITTVSQSFKGESSKTAKTIFNDKIVNSSVSKKLKMNITSTAANMWKDPTIKVMDSYQEEDVIIPGKTPFDAIEMCARRAYGGADTPSSFYPFYQTPQGFRFDSIEQRIKIGKEKLIKSDNNSDVVDPTGLIFTNDAAAIGTHTVNDKKSQRNIKSITSVNMPDTLQRMNSGAFFNNVRTIDLYGKSFTDTKFKISEKYGGFQKLGDSYNLTPDFLSTICEEEPYDFQYVKDNRRRNQTFEKVIGNRLGYIDLFQTYGLQITVPGDTELVAGDIINVRLDEANVTTQDNPVESRYSGYWFVVEVKHVIDPSEIVTVLTIMKDSVMDIDNGQEK